MNIESFSNNNPEFLIKGHAEINIEKMCNDPSISPQAMLASIVWDMFNRMTDVCVKLGIARGKLVLTVMQSGFNSANQTATAGLFQLGGGAVLAGTGVAQGVAGCKSATELAQIAETRKVNLANIDKKIGNQEEPFAKHSDITIEVQALEETKSPSYKINPEEKIETQISKEVTRNDKIIEKKEKQLRKKVNKEYDVSKDLIDARANKSQLLFEPGQAVYYISQGLAEVEKSKGEKETLQKEIGEDNQNQIGNVAEDIKRKADKLTEFDPFRSNSSSLKA